MPDFRRDEEEEPFALEENPLVAEVEAALSGRMLWSSRRLRFVGFRRLLLREVVCTGSCPDSAADEVCPGTVFSADDGRPSLGGDESRRRRRGFVADMRGPDEALGTGERAEIRSEGRTAGVVANAAGTRIEVAGVWEESSMI